MVTCISQYINLNLRNTGQRSILNLYTPKGKLNVESNEAIEKAGIDSLDLTLIN